ncbi:tetratricopeptide repeat protein [Aquimixticola soesokkakensis]|uniref:Tetratricopeptide repeat protein n=1 Tax=Aquimixticola soesokkakensis TaxID=1519096 RepID=A0A1Y5S5P0_9RHOB|nr:tetratricopeptide repeat protein [Aquimixticola soesokkakensis]SLN32665.1 tetratricopeptide repeat protein [Aquimixticola soesokkakensis]
MRHSKILMLCLAGMVSLSACGKNATDDVKRAKTSVNVIDESGLSDIMLSATDPEEAVSYFERASQSEPDRIDLKRGLALSLTKAGKSVQAISIWQQILETSDATNSDRVNLAEALIRAGDWDKAELALNEIPPTYETFQRYRLEAMVADSDKEWQKADSFYETAVGLTTKPSGVLNNWGYSKLSRGDYREAEKLFAQAITYDPYLFTAKNNLVLARGAQGKYDLPVVDMTQSERAELLYTLALSAIKQGDVTIGRGLLQDAIETHPQHFEAAARSLAALEANVVN